MQDAPFHRSVAGGPHDVRAWWLRAEDGVRLRVAHWPAGTAAARGTVLLFPGRTEYVEKYALVAAALAGRGFHTLGIDWRGQGLADRLIANPMSGFVNRFTDYQLDVAAMLGAARALGLPEPFVLLGHSMGGAIGLRALIEDLPCAASVFTGPMWGIEMRNVLRPLAWSLSWLGKQSGMGHVYAPGTGETTYVIAEPFERNKLTYDRDMYQYMIDQVTTHPELAIGGPSMHWLHEALREIFLLSRKPAPPVPALTFCGLDEEIVDQAVIRSRMADWPGGELEMIPRVKHEVLMEGKAMRTRVLDRIDAFIEKHLTA